MIKLTKISGEEILVNADQIEMVERHSDTMISLGNGNKIIVRETLDEVAALEVAFRADIVRKAQEQR